MQIEFYSEFPTKKNLQKLKLIDFPSRIFLAAHSIEKFKKLEKQVKRINKKAEYAYWPLVKNSYWISPFSNTSDLKNLFNNLNKIKNHLLIDLEPPLLNKKLFLKNIFSFFKNKKLIKEFIENNKERITTAQHPFPKSKIIKFLGLNYNINTEKSFMYYTSANHEVVNNRIRGYLKKIENKKNISVGLGTIDRGVVTTKILSPSGLEKDLGFVRQAGFEKTIIFRLGGLNSKYMKVIKKFL